MTSRSLSARSGPAFDTTLLLVWLVILGLGTVMIASSAVAISDAYIVKHGAFLLVSLLGFGLVAGVPLAVWEKCHRLAWLLAVALCLIVLIPGIGLEVNGARRWIGLGAFSLQASEAAKFLVLVYLAGYLARFDEHIADTAFALLRPVLMVGVVGLLVLIEPDFGSVVVLAVAACGMLFVAGARLRHFVMLVSGLALLLAFVAFLQPYRMDRLITFTDPWSSAFGSGYQLTQALIAFGRGELTGLGLGEGIQKLFYLPEAHNDFIFAVIAEELGLIGAVLVVGLFALLVLRILHIARMAVDDRRVFGGYLTYGVGLLLGVQCLVNMGVNTGLLPTKGLTLPFVSYGGNSLLVSCAMLGLVFRTQLEGHRRG
jgi:cell division protein FtsW